MNDRQLSGQGGAIIIRIVVCLIILAIGFLGFMFLKSKKMAPVQKPQMERPLIVAVVSVFSKDVPVTIIAHGELRPIRRVEIAAEVSGRVVAVHPRLQTGEVITEGELLFSIDDRDYRSDYEFNKIRLAILERDQRLASNELTRVRTLFERNKVGSRAVVEKAERAANTTADRLAQVRQAMIRAKIKLEHCRVLAPFTCRITKKLIEKDQFVSPGKVVLGLADDSILELEVPVNSHDAFQWLQFTDSKNTDAPDPGAWFAGIRNVPCEVHWTEDTRNSAQGTLDRVTSFDETTRTVKVAIKIDSRQMRQSNTGMPLVAGMFCRVVIPGGSMQNVMELPRWAVSFENSVYIVRDKRLFTVPVHVLRVQDNKAYISKGLEEGDLVITTRLVNPLERSLVQIAGTKENLK